MRLSFFILLMILASSHSVWARTMPETTAFSLSNGVRVILQEDHSSPRVAVHTMWRLDHVPPARPGLSHFVVHLLAQGESSKTVVALREKGVELAEGTSNDSAGFLASMPASVLPQYLEAERKRYDKLDVRRTTFEDVSREIEREIAGTDLNPDSVLQGAAHLSTFRDPWYRLGHRPVKIFLPDMSAADTMEFFQGNYKSSHLTIAIVGDFHTKQVSSQLEKLWSNFPDHDRKSISFKTEPKPYAEPKRNEIKVLNVDACFAHLGFPIPDSRHNDTAALDILAEILSLGDDSILKKRLVQTRKATDVEAWAPQSLRPHVFAIKVLGREGVSEKELLQVVNSTLKQIAEEGVSDHQLNQVKKNLMERFQAFYHPIDQRATQLAEYDLYYGSYFSFYGRLEEYSKVTMTDIQRVTSTYLLKEPFLNVMIKEDAPQ